MISGYNIISITGTNTSSQGELGCEVYNATINQLKSCQTQSDLAQYVLFSSASASGFSGYANADQRIEDGSLSDIGTYACNTGFTLVYDPNTSSYSCVKILNANCSLTPVVNTEFVVGQTEPYSTSIGLTKASASVGLTY